MRKNYIFYYLLLMIAALSCGKIEPAEERGDDNGELNNTKRIIAKARAKYEKQVSEITKSQNTTILSWEEAMVISYGSIAINVEVPMVAFNDDSLTIYQGSDSLRCAAVSRLIVRHSEKYDKYIFFIVSRAWRDGKPDLTGKKLDDARSNCLTRVYSLDGKLMNEFSNLENVGTTRCNYDGTGICLNCGTYNYSGTRCSYCHSLLVGSVQVVSDHIERTIQPIWENFRKVVAKGKLNHDLNSQSGCYGACCTDLEIAMELPYSTEFSNSILIAFPLWKYSYPKTTLSYNECRELFLHNTPLKIDELATSMKRPTAVDCAQEIADRFCWHWAQYQIDSGGNPTVQGCPHEKCVDCKKCMGGSSECVPCTCPCSHIKCPICNVCFSTGGVYDHLWDCNYCEGNQKHMHLLQDTILRHCPSVSSVFAIRNQFLAVTPFYKWESVELSFDKIRRVNLGQNVFTSIEGLSVFKLYETTGAIISEVMIGLPKDLLINRNTDKLATTFFHELFHTCQPFNLLTAKANAEVEAKLAKLIFAEQAGISQQNTEENASFYYILCVLRSYINDNGYVSSSFVYEYNVLYEELLDHFTKASDYPADKTINLHLSIQTLRSYL